MKYDTGFELPENLHYDENGLVSYKKFDTYQEMARHMIKVWHIYRFFIECCLKITKFEIIKI